MKEDNQFDVPFQVQQLMEAMKNKHERVNIRGNYRTRLVNIKEAIDRAVRDYDTEMGNTTLFKKKKS